MDISCRNTNSDVAILESECAAKIVGRSHNLNSHGCSNILRRYVSEINAFEVLDADVEIALAHSCRAGDIKAAHRLVTSHLRLVVRIAFDYKNYGLPMMDLISEGSLGLAHAVKKFDPSFGCRLSTYAIWWIRAAIQDFILRSWSLVRIGTTAMQRRLFFSLNKIKHKLGIDSSNSLNDDDIKKIKDYTGAKTHEITEMESRISSRDTSMSDVIGDNLSLEDVIACQSQSPEMAVVRRNESSSRLIALSAAMAKLSDRERYIIRERILAVEKSATLEDLSKKFRISRERVRQITERAVEKLKKEVLKITDVLCITNVNEANLS